ncbi:MAG: hypothetical protein NC117_06535 [Pseudoflavonifractor sp.]|nr:hypothetical protein [Pseudoflavonifractor sp.]
MFTIRTDIDGKGSVNKIDGSSYFCTFVIENISNSTASFHIRSMTQQNYKVTITSQLTTLVAVCSILIGLQYMMFPYLQDDLVFMSKVTPLSCNKIKTAFESAFLYDNIRLGNDLFTIGLHLLPKIVSDIISTVFTFMLLIIPIHTCGITRDNSVLGYLMIGALIFLLPWGDHMATSVIFRLNYIWPVTFIFLWIIQFLKSHKIIKGWLILLSVLVGMMHEGASLPLICGCAFYLILNRKKASKGQYVMIISLCIGIAILLLAPCTAYRSTITAQATLLRPVDFYLHMLLLYGNGIIACTAVLIVGISTRRLNLDECLRSKYSIFFIASISGYMVGIFAPTGSRVMWYPQLFALTATFGYSAMIFPRIKTRYNVVKIIMAVAIIVQLSIVDIYSYNISKEYNRIMNLYASSSNGTIWIKTSWIGHEIPALLRHKAPYYICDEEYVRDFNEYMRAVHGIGYKHLDVIFIQ